MKQIPLNEVKDDLSRYLRMAATENIVITRHGVPAGILIGLDDPEDLWEELLLNHPTFKTRIAEARADVKAGKYKTLSEMKAKYGRADAPPKTAKPAAKKRMKTASARKKSAKRK